MKMKFRITKKDVTIYIWFSIILLYIICIGLLNFSSLVSDNKLFGLNPFPAFKGDFLPAVILLFIAAQAAMIGGVTKNIFEREKGIGFKVASKEESGYSRWAEKKEMQSALKKIYVDEKTIDAAGIPIISDGLEVWVDDGESHSLIIGTTGSGKTRRLVDPMIKILAKKGESIILTDPKGELYEDSADLLRELGYNVIVLNFRDPIKGNAWNPLRLPYDLYVEGNQDKSIELLDDLALNILYEEKNNSSADPFWEKTSADYFTGLSLGLFEDATVGQINLNSINLMSTLGEEKIGMSNYIKEYFSMKDPSKPAYINASSTINAPTDTKGSILSVFRQKIKLFSARENLSEMLSHSDFELQKIGREKTAVFIIIQDEKKTLHPLATIFVKQCYETLIDVAQECGGKLPIRTNFILDEFANMPPLKDVTTMVTAARSRQIRFNFIIQNFAQLYQVYGKENGETIKGNCSNLIYLLSSELGALEELSKLCGEVKVKGKDGKPDSTKPLITVSDLQILKVGDSIIKKQRKHPFKTKLPDKSKYEFGFKEHNKSQYPLRDRIVIDLFDVQAFVKAKKEENNKKIFDLLNEDKNKSSNLASQNSVNHNPISSSSQTPPMPLFPGMLSGDKLPNPEDLSDAEIDEMIKRIDAKIAEYEEEERKEKEKNEQAKVENISSVLDNDKDDIIDIDDDEDTVNNIIKQSNVISAVDKNNITDDQFFDDFFTED